MAATPSTEVSRWPAPAATGPICGTVTPPGSKSLTNRALVLSALADGPSRIAQPLRARDTELMVAALRALGTAVDDEGADWCVRPAELRGPARIDCGLAGTVLRFVPPLAALGTGAVDFYGDEQAARRPVTPLLVALRSLGADVHGDRLPFTVLGSGALRGGEVRLDASGSSQLVSGLLLAAPRFRAGVVVRHVGPRAPSRPHLQMTVAELRSRGVAADDTGPDCWVVPAGRLAALDVLIEPDLSSAAPFLAAALVCGGDVRVPGWPRRTTQAGDRMREIATAMGASVELAATGLRLRMDRQPVGLDLDLSDAGELAPVVTAVCALAGSSSRLRGIGH